MVEGVEEILKLVLAGVIGGAVVPYLTHMRERRVARAAVQEHLSVVEQARWAGEGSHQEFRRALYALRANSLVAGLPRSAVDLYVRLAAIGRATSQANYQELSDGEWAGGIPVELIDLINDARALLVDSIWRPWRTRLTMRRRVAGITTRLSALSRGGLKIDTQSSHWSM